MTFTELRRLRWILYGTIALLYGGYLLGDHLLSYWHSQQEWKKIYANQTDMIQQPGSEDYLRYDLGVRGSQWLKVFKSDADRIWLLLPKESIPFVEGQEDEQTRSDYFHKKDNAMDTLVLAKADLLTTVGKEARSLKCPNTDITLSYLEQSIRLDGPILVPTHSSLSSATGLNTVTFTNRGIKGKVIAIEPVTGHVAMTSNYYFKDPIQLPVAFLAGNELECSVYPDNKRVAFRVIISSEYSDRVVWLYEHDGESGTVTRQ